MYGKIIALCTAFATLLFFPFIVNNCLANNKLPPKKVLSPQEKVQQEPDGLTYLNTNKQGYKEYKNKKDGSILIKIPAGYFTMGSDGPTDERPVHRVYLDEYYIAKYEVTNKQYKKFCDVTGHKYPSDPEFSGMSDYFTNYPDYPVVNVSWDDAKAYCDWAGLRLPTEAEWEKAARGKDKRKYPWGDEPPDDEFDFGYNRQFYRCNFKGQGGYEYTAPVGNYERGKSPYGLYDMAGNVWEWCSDRYDDDYYRNSPEKNPKGPSVDTRKRVGRGGSWWNDKSVLRCAERHGGRPERVWFGLGFRCARSQ